MNVYFISGIGADRHIFDNIVLPDYCVRHYLEWITPLQKETLPQYALRLAEAIDHTKPFILVGLSFGGMLATEIARKYPPERLILLSSVAGSSELPPWYRYAGKLQMHRWIPVAVFKSCSLLKRFFTTETREEKIMLREAIRNTDAGFVRWSLKAIVDWKGDRPPVPYIHLHGTADHLLPVRFTSATHIIQGGGHLMILPEASYISQVMTEYLPAPAMTG